jgi:putative protein-disulfide isomerase
MTNLAAISARKMTATLHYLYDPLCGWCYGAEPLAKAAEGVVGLNLRLHAGALWPEPTQLPQNMRLYIQQADARIAQMSGQPFGEPYLSHLLLDPALVLDSRPVVAAVLAAQQLDPTKTLPMLRGIQHAHYEQGLHVVQETTLVAIAESVGLDTAAFTSALRSVPVDRHIAESREFMSNIGAQGFPTFVLQIDDDWLAVPHGRFAAAPAKFAEWLDTQIKNRSVTH